MRITRAHTLNSAVVVVSAQLLGHAVHLIPELIEQWAISVGPGMLSATN